MAKAPIINIEVEGDVQAAFDLRELGVRASDVRRVGPGVKRIYARSEQLRFDRGGPGWPQLADATVARKAQQGLDPRVLVARGLLRASLTAPTAAVGQVSESHPQGFRFGTDLPYAHYHYGTASMPKRDLIELTPREKQQMQELLQKYIGKDTT